MRRDWHDPCQYERDERRRPVSFRDVPRFVRARLHRRLFMWFGASIVVSVVVSVLALSLFLPAAENDFARFRAFVGRRFANSWSDPVERAALARTVAEELHVTVVMRDVEGRPLGHFGHLTCASPYVSVDVLRDDGSLTGRVDFCNEEPRHNPMALATMLLVLCCSLWAAAGVIARKIARPLTDVTRVAQALGDGRFDARVDLAHKYRFGETRILADAINDMAARIEKQLREQKELLAAVSHELRTPLGHMRILIELARDKGTDPKVVDDLEREVLEIDGLVGELLASSRLSFDSQEKQKLEALDVGAIALERVGLPLDLLESEAESIPFEGDATLLGRALANLLENAKRHAGGVERMVILETDSDVIFCVDDHGPGFSPADLRRVFDPFYRGEHSTGSGASSLGLGLSLVHRIAIAHGGRAWAENRPDGGARVAISVKRTPQPRTNPEPAGARTLRAA